MKQLGLVVCVCALVTSLVDRKWWTKEYAQLREAMFDTVSLSDDEVEQARVSAGINNMSFRDQIEMELQALADYKAGFMGGFLQLSQYQNYIFNAKLGSGSYGTVYRGYPAKNPGGEPVSLKLMWDDSDKFPVTKKAYRGYEMLKNAGVSFLIETGKPECETSDSPPMYLCGLLMEHALPVTEAMFLSTSDKNQLRLNANLFLDFAVKMLQGYAEINFKAKCYHADIKPANLMWKKVGEKYEPRIIDFDLTFKMESAGYHPRELIYTRTYRPPEIKKLIPNDEPADYQWDNWFAYKFDKDFREETWVVGETLSKIIDKNKDVLDLKSPQINALNDIIEKMKAEPIKKRISTRTAWELALKSQKEFTKSGKIIV